MSVTIAISPSNFGYLRSATFDNLFIFAIPLLSAISVSLVLWKPSLFYTVLLIDLWLLGYHHVISTFTRFADKETRKEHRFLIIQLPFIIIFSVFIICFQFGVGAIATIYLHWQWYHYLRQSDGIAKAYKRKSKQVESSFEENFSNFVFYLVPAVAFLTLSSSKPDLFLNLPIYTFALPEGILQPLQFLTIFLLAIEIITSILKVLRRETSPALFFYKVMHFCIFFVAYVLIGNIDIGWLAINIWHNAQYIAFVWLMNTNKYKENKDRSFNFIYYLSHPNRFLLYFLCCTIISSTIYLSIQNIINLIQPHTILPLMVIIFQTVNFHHYIVDSKIWKLRKPKIRQQIGID